MNIRMSWQLPQKRSVKVKKLNLKDKKLLKDAGVKNLRQWGKYSEDWESTTFIHYKTGQTVAIRR